MYHFIYITNIPSFYKINLFNEIAKKKKILVIFTDENHNNRNEDFCKGERKFEFISLANKSMLAKIFSVQKLLISVKYKNLFLAGWDQVLIWFLAFINSKNKNSIIIESSIFESKTSGFKGFIKKFFLLRISRAYCSGLKQSEIVKQIGFKGEIIITKGVGVFNFIPQPIFEKVNKVNQFVYVGRLSPEKNLVFLINQFNELPELNLHIVGFGPQELELKSIAKNNIIFHGAVENQKLIWLFKSMHVLVLPSLSEPWGLVVEEALNNGLPVIVSNKVGCIEEVVTDELGVIFEIENKKGLLSSIEVMQNIDFYNRLRFNISKLNFEQITEMQVKCYIN